MAVFLFVQSRCYIDKQSMFFDLKKSIERRRIVSVRKSKTGFAGLSFLTYTFFDNL